MKKLLSMGLLGLLTIASLNTTVWADKHRDVMKRRSEINQAKAEGRYYGEYYGDSGAYGNSRSSYVRNVPDWNRNGYNNQNWSRSSNVYNRPYGNNWNRRRTEQNRIEQQRREARQQRVGMLNTRVRQDERAVNQFQARVNADRHNPRTNRHSLNADQTMLQREKANLNRAEHSYR